MNFFQNPGWVWKEAQYNKEQNMETKSGNYQADIHNTDYENEYLEPRLDAAGLINITGRETESLNGKWNFAADWYDTCRRARWFQDERYDSAGAEKPVDWDWEGWERLTVPATWNTEKPELFYFEGSGVYTRTFRYIPKDKGERLFLRFEGVSYRCSVFLNGVHAGSHDGASTPFNVDISGMVAAENRLVIVADARRSPVRVPMENTDWFNYGGIYRDVYLIRVPKVFIKDWFIRLLPDGSFANIQADVTISANESGRAALEIPELNVKREITLENGKGSVSFGAKPELWSPENPKLYEAVLTYNGDTVRDKIGFREIRTNGNEIFLNGKKIFLKGISVHEDHVTLGKTTTDEVIRAAIRDLKELDGNYLRLAHYPHSRRFAEIACEEGVLLWEEIPVYWAIAFDNPAVYRDAENQLTELILRDRNRAAVIIWSVGNENADTDSRLAFMSKLAQKAKTLDDSRLVSAACLINHEKLIIEDRLADSLDVIGINEYYGWYEPDFNKLPRILDNSKPLKPVVICEFGGGARLGQRGSVDDLFSEDKQKNLYERQIAVIRLCPYIAGMTPWILYDFRCPRRLNRYQQGYNRKGLIDADRKSRKLAFSVLRRFYGEI
jgi:beta-glucuronidase